MTTVSIMKYLSKDASAVRSKDSSCTHQSCFKHISMVRKRNRLDHSSCNCGGIIQNNYLWSVLLVSSITDAAYVAWAVLT
jgi:hypothetical protein